MQRPNVALLGWCGALGVLALALAGAAPAGAQDSVTVTINEVNDSGVAGTATLTAKGDKTLVQLDVAGTVGEHPDHIHRSTCANPEPNPLYPLTDVVLTRADEQGHSETLVDVSLRELLTNPYLILIHKSKDELNVYIACGDISEAASATGGRGGAPTAVPKTGVGPAIVRHRHTDRWLLTAAALAVAAGAAAIAATRSQQARNT